MERVARRPSTRAWILLALVALLGMTVAAGSGNAAASGPGHAVMAKKKCKKKHKRSAGTAKKKKKCKKVHHVVLPAPGPLVRGTLSWSANNEVDLHAFDASGNQAGWDYNVNPPDGSLVNNIPNARHNGDVGPGGPMETFTDDLFVVGGPANREFSYVACLYQGPGVDDYTATFTAVSQSGASSSVTLDGTPSDGGDVFLLTFPGGPAIPNPGSVC
jgi:hypothetical protein